MCRDIGQLCSQRCRMCDFAIAALERPATRTLFRNPHFSHYPSNKAAGGAADYELRPSDFAKISIKRDTLTIPRLVATFAPRT